MRGGKGIFREFFAGCKGGLHAFGQGVAIIVNTVLLLAVYIVGVGATSIAAKMVGKRFLDEGKKDGTYWNELKLKKKNLDDYYRQF